jgi:hypothetical protein
MEIKKEDVITILEYYLPEERIYLYYEKGLYPSWVNRKELINLIAIDICKDELPKRQCPLRNDKRISDNR